MSDPLSQMQDQMDRHYEEIDRLRDRLAAIEPDYRNAMALIRMRGVPEQRAKWLSQALDVLLTRLDREIQALRHVEDGYNALYRQVLWRTEDMPEWATGWIKYPCGLCKWDESPWDCEPIPSRSYNAPDLRPDEPGPLFLPILDPPEEA